MNNFKKTMSITLLMFTIVALSAGCKMVPPGLRSKGTRQALTSTAVRGKPILAEALESRVVQQLSAKVIETGTSSRRIASSGLSQSARPGSAGRGGANFVRDQMVDRYVAVPEDVTSYRMVSRGVLKSYQPRNLNTVISTIEADTGEPYQATGAKDFLSYLDESTSEYIIIIVHNKRGVVSFPNGDEMPLKEMARLINERNKEGIFLSCEAKNYLPDHLASTVKTTFNDALAISEKLAEKLRGGSGHAGHIGESAAFTTRGLQLRVGSQSLPKTYNLDKGNVRKQIQEIINAGERKAEVEYKVFLINKGRPVIATGAAVNTYGGYYYIKLRNNGKTPKISPPKILPTPSNSVIGRMSSTQWSTLAGLSR